MWLTLITGFGAILGSLGIAWAYARANTPRVWQETAEGYRQRAEQLLNENNDLRTRISALEVQVQKLCQRPDMSDVLARNEIIAAELKESLAQIAANLAETVTVTAAELQDSVAGIAERLAATVPQTAKVLEESVLQTAKDLANTVPIAAEELAKTVAQSVRESEERDARILKLLEHLDNNH